MSSTANRDHHQWLAEELEKDDDDLGELEELMDPLSMQQLAESLASELMCRSQQQHGIPRPHQEQQQQSFSYLPVTGPAGMSSFSITDGSAVAVEEQLTTTAGRSGRRTTASSQEHVVSERKRRERMHHQFATLAAIVPDVTKTDKVSVLGSTIEYVHKLRGRIKALQQQQQEEENKLHAVGHHRIVMGCSTAESPPPLGLDAGEPAVEADVRGSTVLLRVVCRGKKGVLVMLLTELEKHGLSIVNTNAVPFADASLNITITAQIEDESSTTVELVNNLNSALKNF